jgi:phage baseplate assembly protein W
MARRRRIETTIDVKDLQTNVAIGIKLPFISKGGGLFQQSYSTQEQAISNLKNLLLTRKGERLYQPAFGTDIYDTLFEPITDTTLFGLRDSILSAISFWLPYITVNDIDVYIPSNVPTDPIGHTIRISLTVQVNNNGANIPITLTISPNNITINV